MNTTETTWIKMSERKPVEADFPLIAWNTAIPDLGEYYFARHVMGIAFHLRWTHWRSTGKVTPPPRELTQREKDEALLAQIESAYIHDGSRHGVKDIALLAIHRERRAIVTALDAALREKNNSKSMKWGVGSSGEAWSSAYAAIRARLEEQSQSK